MKNIEKIILPLFFVLFVSFPLRAAAQDAGPQEESMNLNARMDFLIDEYNQVIQVQEEEILTLQDELESLSREVERETGQRKRFKKIKKKKNGAFTQDKLGDSLQKRADIFTEKIEETEKAVLEIEAAILSLSKIEEGKKRDCENILEQNKIIKIKLRTVEKDYEELEKEISALQNKVKGLESRLKDKENALRESQDQALLFRHEKKNLANRLKIQKKENEAQKEKTKMLLEKIKVTEGLIPGKIARIENPLKQKVAALEKELSEAEQSIPEQVKRVKKSLQVKIEKLENKAKETEQLLVEKEAMIKNLEKDKQAVEKKLRQAKKESTEREEFEQELSGKNKKEAARCEQIEQANEFLQAKVAVLESREKETEQMLAARDVAIESFKKEKQSAEEKFLQIKAAEVAMKKLVQELKDEKEVELEKIKVFYEQRISSNKQYMLKLRDEVEKIKKLSVVDKGM